MSDLRTRANAVERSIMAVGCGTADERVGSVNDYSSLANLPRVTNAAAALAMAATAPTIAAPWNAATSASP